MLANFHTHTTFCDGENTPEEIVLYAIDNGFDSIGFSGHGFTPFDLRYCMRDVNGYISEVNRLKRIYENKIQIYCGIEEDVFSPAERKCFDYIIGSSHYFYKNGNYYPIDSDYDYFKKCLGIFKNDIIALSQTYYKTFCEYILTRKPDIVGHFDLITKFDEVDVPRFLCNDEYFKIAEMYLETAIKADVVFEVNTGAVAKKLRSSPYPHERLLHIIKKHNAKIILSSDSHSAETLDYNFKETRRFLRNIGFEFIYVFCDKNLKKESLY